MPGDSDHAELLTPYLPRVLLRWLAEDPSASFRRIEGSVAFCDVSGFTKLSERLARQGKVGAELLAGAINACFERLLASAYAAGGSLIKFGGDALLLFFDGSGHAAKASRAAHGMRRELRDIGALEFHGANVRLRMSSGVHSGLFDFFLVGESHRELMITGPAATHTVAMEAAAGAGQIVVSRATAAALTSGAVGAAAGDGYILRRAPSTPMAASPDPGAHAAASALLECVPVGVREHVLAGLHEPEHRPVVVAFVHFEGTDAIIETEGPEAAAGALGALVRDVQRAAGRHGVLFLATDIDADGGKIILTGGAPVLSGDDEERMLLALREIVEAPRRLPVRIGVNRGHVFSGDIGPAFRRTYTVMGDAVNLAARVMARAEPGTVLATESVLERSKTPFETTALEPFMVKGKARPVRAWKIGAKAGARERGAEVVLRLCGREREMDALRAALASALDGRGALVEITGDTGIGKSRLLEEIAMSASDATVLTAGCEPQDVSTPYSAVRPVVRRMLGIPERADGDAAARRLREVVAALVPEAVPWVPLLGPLVDAGIPETRETAQIEERFRRSRLAEVLLTLLDRLLRAPALLVFDDAHWMDDASADLLNRVGAVVGARPWLLCVARRDVPTGFASRTEGSLSLQLEPLDRTASEALLSQATEGVPLRPDETTAVIDRSGGNPLFLRELLAATGAGGLGSLPDSIEALVMARIDALHPLDRALLRHASVLGRTFSHSLMRAVAQDAPARDDPAWDRLASFVALEGDAIRFTHALVRDVAYEGLPYRLRRDLHAQAGEAIEQSAAEDAAELLSFHFVNAQRYEKAWRYSMSAAARAEAMYANVEAAGFYERALEAARRGSCATQEDALRAEEALGDVRARFGAYEGAAGAYRSVLRRIKGSVVEEARVMHKVARIKGWMARYPQALSWIRRGLNVLEGRDGEAADRQRAELLASYAYYLLQEGRHGKALDWAARALEQAEQAGDLEAVATACKVMDWAAIDLGTLEEPVNARRALAIYEETGDLPGQASILNMLGNAAYWRGDWNDARAYFERARDTVHRTGNTVMYAFCINNIGEILADQGRAGEAETLFREAARVWESAGHRSGFAYVKSNIARVAARAGRFDEALPLYEEARAESADVGAESDILEADTRIAEFWLLRGDIQRALDLAGRALRKATAHEGVVAQVPALHRIRGHALEALGDRDGARAAYYESLGAARARRSDYEVALTLQPLARLEAAEGGETGPLDAESAGILRRLGVVRLPEVRPLAATTSGDRPAAPPR